VIQQAARPFPAASAPRALPPGPDLYGVRSGARRRQTPPLKRRRLESGATPLRALKQAQAAAARHDGHAVAQALEHGSHVAGE
jgi:hypothetical protein